MMILNQDVDDIFAFPGMGKTIWIDEVYWSKVIFFG